LTIQNGLFSIFVYCMTKKIKNKTIYLSIVALATVLLSRLLGRESAFIEQFYYRGLFQALRVIYDYTFGLLPIPMIYVFIMVMIFVLFIIIKRLFDRSIPLIKRLFRSGHLLFQTLSILVIIFYWFWGFNYNRQSIESYLELDSSDLDTTQLLQIYDQTHNILLELRSQFDMNQKMADIQKNPTAYENYCRQSLTYQLDQLSYPTNGRVRIRSLRPQGSLLRISTAGVYWPFVFEGHIDPGLHPMTWPFTMSHEMGHGYGFTDEGTCNFLGWLACTTHEDPFIQYSGWIGYFRYLLTNIRRAISPAQYKNLYDSIDQKLIADLSDIRNYAMRYPDIMPVIRDVVYDNYLKSHGVKGGLINYSKIIKLVYAWEKKHYKSK